MAQAKRDDNQVTTLLGVSNADGTTPVTLYADPTTHRLLVTSYTFVVGETPNGTVGGGNKTFTLANTPATGSVALYHNGIRLNAGAGNDYTISGLTITFAAESVEGDVILADYKY